MSSVGIGASPTIVRIGVRSVFGRRRGILLFLLPLVLIGLAVLVRALVGEDLVSTQDTLYGLGAGVWTRDGSRAYRVGRAIKAGRVWTNCYHQYPAHAAFGGYKQSGIGRENHKMMLDHYQQTKNLLVSYSPDPLGFF